MSEEDQKAIDEYIISELGKAKPSQELLDAVNDYTLWRIHRIYHIPTKYFLLEDKTAFNKLADEIILHGYIDLDSSGTPCVLSGQEPVYKEAKHG